MSRSLVLSSGLFSAYHFDLYRYAFQFIKLDTSSRQRGERLSSVTEMEEDHRPLSFLEALKKSGARNTENMETEM